MTEIVQASIYSYVHTLQNFHLTICIGLYSIVSVDIIEWMPSNKGDNYDS